MRSLSFLKRLSLTIFLQYNSSIRPNFKNSCFDFVWFNITAEDFKLKCRFNLPEKEQILR